MCRVELGLGLVIWEIEEVSFGDNAQIATCKTTTLTGPNLEPYVEGQGPCNAIGFPSCGDRYNPISTIVEATQIFVGEDEELDSQRVSYRSSKACFPP